jgi:DMSO/TMAO reductase YedYZ molybdopterin-dependent catalytic subunit
LQLAGFAARDVLLAHRSCGASLERGHAGPIRFGCRISISWKSAKWVDRIDFVADDAPGSVFPTEHKNQGSLMAEVFHLSAS